MKITIIDVDLGNTIEEIIEDEVKAITTENKQQITEIIKETKMKQQVIDDAKKRKTNDEKTKNDKLMETYQRLLARSNESPAAMMMSKDILTITTPEMPNIISFVGKMRNWLISNKINYKLSSMKIGKTQGYRLDEIKDD